MTSLRLDLIKFLVLRRFCSRLAWVIKGVRFALNTRQEIESVANEGLMVEDDLLGAALALVEVVHVELPHEGVDVVVLEVLGQHLLLEVLP